MSCILVKNIKTNETIAYSGKLSILEYANQIIKNSQTENCVSFTLKFNNSTSIDIVKTSVSTGYIYNANVKEKIYNLQTIQLISDTPGPVTFSQIVKQQPQNNQLHQAVMSELKNSLNKKFQNTKDTKDTKNKQDQNGFTKQDAQRELKNMVLPEDLIEKLSYMSWSQVQKLNRDRQNPKSKSHYEGYE